MLDFDECVFSTCEKNDLVFVVYFPNSVTQRCWFTFLYFFLNSRDETIMVSEQFIGCIYFFFVSVCMYFDLCMWEKCKFFFMSKANREFCNSFLALSLIPWGRLSSWAWDSQFLTWAGNKEFYSFQCLYFSQSWGYDLYDCLPCLFFIE